MRRSVREAIVGFSIGGAIAGFAGTMLWLRGVRLGSETWTVTADFANAGGLAARSPVTFRGIMVGTVRSVDVTPMSVRATLEISADLTGKRMRRIHNAAEREIGLQFRRDGFRPLKSSNVDLIEIEF